MLTHPVEVVLTRAEARSEIKLFVIFVVVACLALVVGGCSTPTPPGRSLGGAPTGSQGTTVEQHPASGVDKGTFSEAWDRVKDITVATSVVTTLGDFRGQVEELRTALDSIEPENLNADEKAALSSFYSIHEAYADSVALWELQEADDGRHEGIPLFRDGEPLVPRADVIVSFYGLPLATSTASPSVEYVPKDSVQKLWKTGYARAAELLPILER